MLLYANGIGVLRAEFLLGPKTKEETVRFQIHLEKALGFLVVIAACLAALYWLAFQYVWPVAERRQGAAAMALIILTGFFVWWRIKSVVNGGK